MILSIYLPAGEGYRYDPRAFDKVPGQAIDVVLGNDRRVPAVVRSTKVLHGGMGVDLTIEIEEEMLNKNELWEAFRAGLVQRLNTSNLLSYAAFEEWVNNREGWSG